MAESTQERLAFAQDTRIAVWRLPSSEAPMNNDHQILTIKEVSKMLGVHPSTVYKLIREGRIPSFRVGNDWRFLRDLIVRWMAEQ